MSVNGGAKWDHDGCAAFSAEAHDGAIASLATVSTIATCAEVIAALGPT